MQYKGEGEQTRAGSTDLVAEQHRRSVTEEAEEHRWATATRSRGRAASPVGHRGGRGAPLGSRHTKHQRGKLAPLQQAMPK
jgi:hypothetical protein